MREITLFCEDSFHQSFIEALLRRFSAEWTIPIRIRALSSQGGLPRMQAEFQRFLRDLARDCAPQPDAVLVVVDANCRGYNARRKLMKDEVRSFPQLSGLIEFAIPDPHIERWMLSDPQAFQAVFGRGCTVPAVKCAKDEYKRLLRAEIRQSGIEPPLGGQEFAEDIVRALDLGYVETHEDSFRRCLKTLKSLFNRWRA